MDFKNEVVLITGVSSGIGQRLATDLARLGAKVIGCGRSQERLQETLDYLQSLLDLVERQYNAGMSVLDLLKQAGLPAYRKWALYSDQHPLNVQHVYSELEKEELEK